MRYLAETECCFATKSCCIRSLPAARSNPLKLLYYVAMLKINNLFPSGNSCYVRFFRVRLETYVWVFPLVFHILDSISMIAKTVMARLNNVLPISFTLYNPKKLQLVLFFQNFTFNRKLVFNRVLNINTFAGLNLIVALSITKVIYCKILCKYYLIKPYSLKITVFPGYIAVQILRIHDFEDFFVIYIHMEFTSRIF